MRTDVACTLTVSSPVPATALLQVAVTSPDTEVLTVVSAGQALSAQEADVDGARVHRLELAAGETTIAYSASVQAGGPPREVTAADWATYPRPSRYCPSGQVVGFAAREFGQTTGRASWSARSPAGSPTVWSTSSAPAGRWTPPSTRCWPAPECAVTTPT